MSKQNILGYLRNFFSAQKKDNTFRIHYRKHDSESIKHKLKDLMTEKKPFLQRGYHIKELAAELQIPVHQLSTFLNQVLGMHFSDHINKYRIDHCIELINTNLSGRPNLQQLSKICGFNNRSSFTSAFKKFTGQKPFDYIKRRYFLQIMNNYREKVVNNYNF
jgi:AraC-like DNA-binding protein